MMNWRRTIALAGVLAGLAGGAAVLALNVDLRSDLGFFLPRDASTITGLVAGQLRESPTSGLILAAISGGDATERARASDMVTRALAKTRRFTFVANGRPKFDKADLDALLANRYVLNPSIMEEDFSAEGLKRKLKAALRQLGTTAGMAVKDILPADPTLRTLEIATFWAGTAGPKRSGGIWVSADGAQALFVALPEAKAFDFDRRREIIASIQKTFEQTKGTGTLALKLTGPSIIALDTRDRIKSEAQWLAILSVVLVGGLLLAVFRAPTLLLVVAIPIAAGLLAGAASVQLAFGHIHGITLAFGNILIGVATDYPMHLAVHREPGERPNQAMRRIWPTLRLGAITTVVAFLPMSAAGFPGLSQLGVFAAVGLLAAAGMTRWVLPALMAPVDRPPAAARPIAVMDWPGWTRWMPPFTGVLAVLAVGFLTYTGPGIWESDLRALSPVPRASLELDRSLRAALQGPDVRRMLVVTAPTAEQALQRLETLEPVLRTHVKQGAISGYDAAARYLPSEHRQRDAQRMLPNAATLRANLEQATGGLPFRAALFEPFLAAVEKARSGPPLGFESFAEGRFGWRVTPLLFPHGGRWIGLVTLSGIEQPADGQTPPLKPQTLGPGVSYVDLKVETDKLMADYRDSSLFWLGAGGLAAIALLIAGLRHAGSVIRIAAPIVCSVLITAALLVATGNPLSIIHIMALLLVAGLGLDYALFLNRAAGTRGEAEQTKLAVILANLTTIMVFALMAFSQIPVLNSMGKTVAIGAVLSILTANGFRKRSSAK